MDVDEAVVAILSAPFIGLAIAVLFYLVVRVYLLLKPMGTDGPFVGAYNTLGSSLKTSYNLFQLTSSIET